MLIVSIPENQDTGNCRINGQTVEFKITKGIFSFREKDQEWQDRRILDSGTNNEKLVMYVCE